MTGTRTEIYDHDGDHLEGSAFVKGRVAWKQTSLGFMDKWQGTYNGTIDGRAVVATAKAHGTGILIPTTHSVQASATIKVCVTGAKCVTSYDGYELPLSPEMDGSWMLSIDTSAQGKKLAGSAVLTLSNERAFTYQIQGTYDEPRQRGVLRLLGTGEAGKSRLTLWVQGDQLLITRLTGRLLGQSLIFP